MRVLAPKTAYMLLIVIPILYSHSASAQWQYSHYDVYPDIMRDCAAVDSNTFWAVGSFGYVIKSTDSGKTWSPFSYAHLTDDLYELDFPDPKHGFAASGPTGSTTIIGTVDSGETWHIVHSQLPLDWICGLEFSDSSNGLVAGANGIYLTSDGGNNWNRPDSFVNTSPTAICMINSEIIWGCGFEIEQEMRPRIIESTNGGNIWFVNSTLGDTLNAWVRAIEFSDVNHGWVILQSITSDTCPMFATTNAGTTWDLTSQFYDGTSINVYKNIVAFDSLNLRIAGEVDFGIGEVRRSSDGGYTWIDEFRGYVGVIQGISMFDSAHGLVVGGPIWDNTPLILYYEGSVGIDDNFIKPEVFSLFAYPNPFNSSTIISFSNLKSDGIKIFDIKGSLVRILRPEQKENGSIIWDATDDGGRKVSSGIYFARASSGGNSKTIKLIYLK